MSGRDWRPGDVATVRFGTGEWETAIRQDSGEWACKHATDSRGRDDVEAYPLFVIDPEDEEQVERLHAALGWLWSGPANLQAAIRSLMAPPKPEVFAHLVTHERVAGENIALTSLCGKVWNPNDEKSANVVGRCPDCERAASDRWRA